MFLHLGEDCSISTQQLIAIIDFEMAEQSKTSAEFLDLANKNSIIQRVGKGPHKSFVITEEAVFFSPISSSTLEKRVHNGDF